jgi:hypothetical protein
MPIAQTSVHTNIRPAIRTDRKTSLLRDHTDGACGQANASKTLPSPPSNVRIHQDQDAAEKRRQHLEYAIRIQPDGQIQNPERSPLHDVRQHAPSAHTRTDAKLLIFRTNQPQSKHHVM